MAAGMRQRHTRICPQPGRCACPWEVSVFDARAGRKIRKTFPDRAAAKLWRQDAQVALRQGTMRAPSRTTVHAASIVWLDGARRGEIRTRSGRPYKPSAIRAYETALRLRVLPGRWAVCG